METITPVSIANPIPPVLIAVSSDALQAVRMIEVEARTLTAIESQEQAEAADLLVARAVAMDKQIEASRVKVKAPVLELGRLIDEAAGDARAPLLAIKASLGREVLAWTKAENERRAALRRQQEEQARQAAEAARKAEEEYQSRVAAEKAAAEAARVAAQQEDPDDLPPVEAVAVEDDAPPVEAVAVEKSVTILTPAILPPTFEERQAARPVRSSSVKVSYRKKAEITDAALLMTEALKNRGVLNGLRVLIFDEKTLFKAAEAGVPFPGVTVTEREIIGAKG
jgi:hypothetical protein